MPATGGALFKLKIKNEKIRSEKGGEVNQGVDRADPVIHDPVIHMSPTFIIVGEEYKKAEEANLKHDKSYYQQFGFDDWIG